MAPGAAVIHAIKHDGSCEDWCHACAASRGKVLPPWETALLRQRAERAEAIVAAHDLCHNLHGKVDARAFADGCADEQRRLYGCAPDADVVAESLSPTQLWILCVLIFLCGIATGWAIA